MKDLKKKIVAILSTILILILSYLGVIGPLGEEVGGVDLPVTGGGNSSAHTPATPSHTADITIGDNAPVMLDEQVAIPDWEGDPYIIVNDNKPSFSKSEKQETGIFEFYSELDESGRCGIAFANICEELMPTDKRGDISRVHPTGWQKGMGWERCHLIGFQLAGENANDKNLVTGSHYLNVIAMLPLENQVANYVKDTGNHVLYRVTPVFDGDDMVPSGVEMEAWSVEDKGKGVCFNVYAFNVVPGSVIDYDTGIVTTSSGSDSQSANVETVIPEMDDAEDVVYVSKSGKIHTNPNCSGMSNPSEMTLEEAEGEGYVSCPKCGPDKEAAQ